MHKQVSFTMIMTKPSIYLMMKPQEWETMDLQLQQEPPRVVPCQPEQQEQAVIPKGQRVQRLVGYRPEQPMGQQQQQLTDGHPKSEKVASWMLPSQSQKPLTHPLLLPAESAMSKRTQKNSLFIIYFSNRYNHGTSAPVTGKIIF